MKSAVFNYKHNTIIIPTNFFAGSNELKEKIACKNITTCNNKNEPLYTTSILKKWGGGRIRELWPNHTNLNWNGILRCQCMACLEN